MPRKLLQLDGVLIEGPWFCFSTPGSDVFVTTLPWFQASADRHCWKPPAAATTCFPIGDFLHYLPKLLTLRRSMH